MSDRQLLERITLDPEIMAGKPIIRGTRLTVEYILNLLARGATIAKILQEYEGLTPQDIQACKLSATQASIVLRTGERVNLTKLSNWLLARFSLRQLRLLASELGLVAHSLGLDNPALKKEAVVTMVSQIVGLQRLDDLIAACAHQDAGFDVSRLDFPHADWTPRPLPTAVIEIVNRTLGRAGHPYSTLTAPVFENQWTPAAVDTGCYCWPLALDIFPEILSSEPRLFNQLIKVRHAIAEESAFAYFGVEKAWGQLGLSIAQPCIVAAPTVDQFDAIRIEQTEAGNADLDPIELINALKSVDVKYGLDILASDESIVEFRLTNMTMSQKASFSRWLKAFAPEAYLQYKWDTKRQSGNLKPIRLWWD